jgi:hypothetical protein
MVKQNARLPMSPHTLGGAEATVKTRPHRRIMVIIPSFVPGGAHQGPVYSPPDAALPELGADVLVDFKR